MSQAMREKEAAARAALEAPPKIFGIFNFVGSLGGTVFTSSPPSYEITFDQPVEGTFSTSVGAAELGFDKARDGDEETFMNKFFEATRLSGQVEIVEAWHGGAKRSLNANFKSLDPFPA